MNDRDPFKNWPQPEDESEEVKPIPSGTPEQIQNSLFLLKVLIRLVETDNNHVPQLDSLCVSAHDMKIRLKKELCYENKG
jgi:hypothetical protein|tara:strand:+ start:653 stop:892 length:240 start_codon:yes stop_codon:yes gene_type:complete